MDPAQDDQGADLEAARQARRPHRPSRRRRSYSCRKISSGTSSSAATWLHQRSTCVVRQPGCLRIGQGGLPEPDVGQLVRQREHLRRLGVRAVDEHQRRQVVRHREAAELLGVEMRRLLLSTTPLHMTRMPSASACSMKRRRASVQVGIRRRSSRSKPSACRISRPSLRRRRQRARNRQTPATPRPWTARSRGTTPGVAGRCRRCRAGRGSDGRAMPVARVRKSGIGTRLDRRLLEEQVADRRVGRLGEPLDLLQRRPDLAPLPGRELGEDGGQCLSGGKPGPLACPMQQFRSDSYLYDS